MGSLEERLYAAQWACYGASCSGKGRINEYSDETGRLAQRNLQIETRLREVLHNGGLALALQPKIRLADRRITGAEALVRWTDAELGPIPPSEFIPIAERLGLIGNITDWVLRQSIAEISRCADQSISVAVNFCALDFLQSDLIQNVDQVLSQLKANPARLVIELTESVVAYDATLVNSRMQQVKALGAAISLDDFGTGYSSLSYLRQFPIDSLKIDISFVRDMPEKADAVAITAAIVSMAKALGLDTIAEGVENTEQAELLRVLDVDLCQGNLFSKPISSVEFRRLLEAQRH
jgi:EAL domain-containing protein (putative c-di-GMP-specific phosphodiesterase class I)